MELLERVVPIAGTQLHVQEAGEGPSILFVHGMCGDADVWSGQVERLSDSFRCVAYDRRGHSRSPLGENAERTVQLHADDAAELIRALDLAPVILVGSSGGARIGVDLVLRYASLLRGAVLSEPAILAYAPERFAEFRSSLGPALEAAATPGDAVEAFFILVDPAAWATMSDSRREAYRANSAELFGDLGMPPYLPSREDLAAVRVPVRLLTGGDSLPLFKEVAAAIASGIPGAQLVELEGASHATYVLQPNAFADAVRSFQPR